MCAMMSHRGEQRSALLSSDAPSLQREAGGRAQATSGDAIPHEHGTQSFVRQAETPCARSPQLSAGENVGSLAAECLEQRICECIAMWLAAFVADCLRLRRAAVLADNQSQLSACIVALQRELVQCTQDNAATANAVRELHECVMALQHRLLHASAGQPREMMVHGPGGSVCSVAAHASQ